MPRSARKESETGVYHIIARGINRQDIFLDDEDRTVYLDRLLKYKIECEFSVYAYCLMSNHVHILLKEDEDSISTVMQRIGTSYAYWFNRKYNRTGHLFQDRFKSEPVENERYLLAVVRYIHQNPVKIGLSISEWTSYNEYIRSGYLVDTGFILDIFNENIENAKESFVKFVSKNNDDCVLDVEEQERITDESARAIAKSTAKIANCLDIQGFHKAQRDIVLKQLKGKGLSVRQLERITGINRGVILRADVQRDKEICSGVVPLVPRV